MTRDPADGADFAAWYPGAHRRLVASLVVLSGGIDEARDVADEAMARAYQRWRKVGTIESPEGWVYRVAVNLVRRRGRRRQLEAQLLRRARPARITPAPADEVWDALVVLTDRQRAVIVLRFVADLTEKDIATALGITRSTVSSTLADAIRRLRIDRSDVEREVERA